jgi:hypothetical protein
LDRADDGLLASFGDQAASINRESTKNRGRLGSLDRCGADLLAKSLGNIGTLERAGGPAAGASPSVLGALFQRGSKKALARRGPSTHDRTHFTPIPMSVDTYAKVLGCSRE